MRNRQNIKNQLDYQKIRRNKKFVKLLHNSNTLEHKGECLKYFITEYYVTILCEEIESCVVLYKALCTQIQTHSNYIFIRQRHKRPNKKTNPNYLSLFSPFTNIYNLPCDLGYCPAILFADCQLISGELR